ncbi:Glycosyl hydrolases family 31 [Bryocella elongata]|uniref:Glycosyl hydrolases family 31 n=1 Tax=Bryocella elongata TaxID=863522 RepID=A0A1H5TBY0_9BACT|nr:TIM-barrel domain-containing protein [Bryocella elongata]SEF60274.1 Glycosyl hydrolases family 31 [Bryocella elongata]
MEGARYSFMQGTDTIVGAAPVAGILIDGSPVTLESHEACSHSNCMLHGRTTRGATLTLDVEMRANEAVLAAEVQPAGAEVRFVTAGAAPAYGLADHAVEQRQFSTDHKPFYDTEVSGFTDDEFLSGQGLTRLVSNFVIYPRQQFAELLIDPTAKIVHTSAKEIVQGVKHAEGELRLYYFFGDPHQIYAAYREARNAAGYRIWMPKYEALGVGWEAFGALGWNTNAKTDQESIDRYLKEGYPLRWAVIGSGFWPSKPETMHETTSFGLWDKAKYPDPAALIQHLHDEKLTVMLGLRITFIVGGPYSDEGVAKGYFLKEDGRARIYRGGWPHSPYYLLDAHNPQALDWYMSLVKKWQDYGIGGWKEDFYGYGGSGLRDDKVDPTNDRLMAQKQLVIERNGYLSSNGDLHRINDFNYDQDQDRGPVNALAFAYSGFPLVYPDIVGGTFGESRFNTQRTERMQVYVARNAQWAAMHSSMGMGEPPWSFSASTAKVMLQAAKLHERIAPYLFSNARRFYEDGYPWTMTPLPIAFPNDPKAYGRENEKDRAYEWMIGDSILATPLYGGDFDTAKGRDVYLPAGEWMDFDTGKLYDGDQMLRGYSLPIGKTPMFIGGPGVTLEAIDGVNRICIYPVSLQATTTITLPGSDRPIRVAVQGLRLGMTWRSVEVVDGEGRAVAVRREGHGFSFVPAAAASYRVIAKP